MHISTAFAFYITSEKHQDTREKIRIGCSYNYAVVKNPIIKGSEGYGYEYINEILKYTHKKYKPVYVELEWSEALRQLESGEIDILAGASYTEERAQKFLFSKEKLANEMRLLMALHGNSTDPKNNYEVLNGKTIYVSKGNALLSSVYDFVEKNNLTAKIHEGTLGSTRRVIADGSYDYILIGSLHMEAKRETLLSFESSPVYLMANKEKTELMEDFDQATETLLNNDYLFKDRLYLKYFDKAISQNIIISEEELKLLQDKKVYNVGLTNLNSILSFKTSNGQNAGLFIDIMKMIANLADVKFNFIEYDKNTNQELIKSLDFGILPANVDKNLDLRISEPFANLGFVYLTKDPSLKKKNVGTLSYYELEKEHINFYIGEQDTNLFQYDNPLNLITAFNEGIIDTIFMTGTALNSMYDDLDNVEMYNTISVDFFFRPVILFSANFPDKKIEIINKLLASTNLLSIENISSRNVALFNTKDESYYFAQYGYIFLLCSIGIVFIFIHFHQKLKKEKEEEVRQAIDIDPLTGLFARQKFLTETSKILLESLADREYYLVSLDIDNFRYMNEVYGYNKGSQILQQIGHYIKQQITIPLPMTRYAGDNFAILVDFESLGKRHDLAKYLEETAEEIKESIGKDYNMNLSVGIYKITDKTQDVQYMLDCANIARNKSKAHFGTRIEFFNEEMKKNYIGKNEMLSLVKNAITNKEFQLYYQPKFDILTMRTTGAEALIRWFIDGKLIPPNYFIPIIESNGFIDELDYYIIELACAFLAENKKLDIPKISVNVSGFTIVKEDVVSKVVALAEKYNIAPSKLDLEITESALVENFSIAIPNIHTLRNFGFSFSMDDFGAGVSSLNRLASMPIDTLKIDREFLADSLENVKSSIIVKHVIELAEDLKIETVAEGIETIEQLELLRKFGCNLGQGYYYAKPMPAKDFLEYVKNMHVKDAEKSLHGIPI